MQRMRGAAVNGAVGGNESLSDHLAAEDPLPADLRAHSAEKINLERLDVEDGKQLFEGAAHGWQDP